MSGAGSLHRDENVMRQRSERVNQPQKGLVGAACNLLQLNYLEFRNSLSAEALPFGAHNFLLFRESSFLGGVATDRTPELDATVAAQIMMFGNAAYITAEAMGTGRLIAVTTASQQDRD